MYNVSFTCVTYIPVVIVLIQIQYKTLKPELTDFDSSTEQSILKSKIAGGDPRLFLKISPM